MDQKQQQKTSNEPTVSFISLGGLEDVTRNMYLYEYNNQILIVDCGLGFPDESMFGVDLLLPDISYLLDVVKKGNKKIVGMVLTHGHEDHIGGLPFILPQLPQFPIYASPLTAALANEKLQDYKVPANIKTVQFTDDEIPLGDFRISFVRVTHSILDSANIIIKTPVGNLYHGSDFKFDLTPADGHRTDFLKITKVAQQGFLALMSDCLGSERDGFTQSEQMLGHHFEREMRNCPGKFIITTYSSNVSRLNQAIQAAEMTGRKVCFVGRSILKVKQVADRLGYLKIHDGTEVQIADLPQYKSKQLVLLVAGSQGQENSAMTRIAEGEHRDIRLDPQDTVVFSSDTIPGNELNVNELYDSIAKRGAHVLESNGTGMYHVSGHGSAGDHMLLIALTQPRFLLPISGTYRHMVDYRTTAMQMGYKRNDIFLVENGQEVLFGRNNIRFGKKIEIKHVYVDQISGEELENFVIRDRERLAKEGVVIIMAEVKASDGQLAEKPEVIARGSYLTDTTEISQTLAVELEKVLSRHREKVINWFHVRRTIGETSERFLYKKLRTRPLVLPVVIEV
ncbi:MAG TPA: ribonuclease J [Candidatus Sulfotelmatobacter sp.]|jgi:ribonuclease J|nr:ribonuclease J [Candidatus Sulfotelmatobacter sp.]